VHAYYPAEAVEIKGPVKVYSRPGNTGCFVIFQFCPDCGSTVAWTAEANSGNIGVPIGLFADPAFPPPTNATFVVHKYPWFAIPEGVTQNAGHSAGFLARVTRWRDEGSRSERWFC
jgi:hypothetical protein